MLLGIAVAVACHLGKHPHAAVLFQGKVIRKLFPPSPMFSNNHVAVHSGINSLLSAKAGNPSSIFLKVSKVGSQDRAILFLKEAVGRPELAP